MKTKLLQVSWHDRQPIWSIDISPCTGRLLTTGSDRVARLWSLHIQQSLEYSLQWIAELKGHEGTVNVGRFHPQGNTISNNRAEDLIATGSDGGTIVLWERLVEASCALDKTEETLERWRIRHVLRKHLQDVLDLQWSRCGRYLISGSVDNKVIIWDMNQLNATRVMEGHHHFVQGVAADPLGEYFTSQSADRSLRIYQKTRNKNGNIHFPCRKSIWRLETDNNNVHDSISSQQGDYLFLDDSHSCLFRRMDWSPDGSFLVCPAAQVTDDNNISQEEASNKHYAVVLFARGHWDAPVFQLLGYDKPVTVVKVCPLLLDRISRPQHDNIVQLQYNVVFAVATLDTVFLYDIYEPFPIGYVKGMHWQPITDLCWSRDGQYLLVCSIDGYISVVYFESNELGNAIDASSFLAIYPTQLEEENKDIQSTLHSVEQSTEESNTRYITQWVTPKPKRSKTMHSEGIIRHENSKAM